MASVGRALLSRDAPWRESLRKFVAPVPGENLPALRLHLARGAPLYGLVATAAVVFGSIGAAATGRAIPARVGMTGLVTIPLLLFLIHHARSAKLKNPERVILAINLVLVATLFSSGWTSLDGRHDDIQLLFLLPLGVACFVPWKPTYTLVLGAVAFGAFWLAIVSGTSGSTFPVLLMAEVTLICTGIGATANQLHRHLWQSLESSREQIAALDRAAGLGFLTAGLAHEVKTPIASTMNSLQLADQLIDELERSIGHADVTNDDLREIVRELGALLKSSRSSTERVGQIIRRVREHTRGMHATSSTTFFVRERIEAVEGLVAHQLLRSQGKLDFSAVAPDAALDGDIGKFDQILLNLFINAIEAGEAAGKGVTVRIETDVASDGALIVSVQDDGPGFSPEARSRLFQPMYTTKASGTGLGLTISRDLAAGAFGGSLELVPTEVGARFELRCGTSAPARSTRPYTPDTSHNG